MQLKSEGNSVSGRGNSKYKSPEAQKPLASFGMAHSPCVLTCKVSIVRRED